MTQRFTAVWVRAAQYLAPDPSRTVTIALWLVWIGMVCQVGVALAR